MGIDSAQSNMPAEYAGGGIVAFADEGLVEDPYESYSPYDTPPGYSPDFGPEGSWKSILGRFEMPHEVYSKKDIKRMEEQNKGMQDLFGAKGTTARSPILPGTYAGLTPPQAQPSPQAQPPAGPATPPATPNTGFKIERGLEAPPATPRDAAASAFSGIDDIYKAHLERSRADRDELRSMILGQKADRAEQEAENRNLALMKAGFGMMAGQSPFAGVNVARGGLEGAESYGRGLEQLRAGDRQIIQQLASLGLKGQELENKAMDMGIDISKAKMMEPYYASAAEENRAKSGLYPAQKELYGAEAAHQLASANEATMRTALLPGEQDIKRLKQVAAGYKGTPGAGQFMSKLQDWRRNAYMDPTSSGVMFDAETTKGLTYPKESGTYQRAVASARAAIDNAFAQNVREFQYVGGSREGGSSSSE
jgi:hypothetical protein